MRHISTTDARKSLSDLVSEVEFGKETIVLTRRNRDVAALVPLEEVVQTIHHATPLPAQAVLVWRVRMTQARTWEACSR